MISGFRFKDNYDWFNKKINPEVEYFSKENKWWDDNILSLEEYYEIERIAMKNKIFKMLLPKLYISTYLPKRW